jgi:hypothetical protein
MQLSTVKTLIIDRYERRNANRMSVLFLEGQAGIGKTEIVRQAAKDLGVRPIVVCLAAMEAADFSGLPQIDKQGETKYARPNWLPDGPAIVFFDEVNRAAVDTLQPLLQVLQDREINGHKVHPDTLFIMAGNPAGGEYNTQELDPALKDRSAILKVEPDFQGLQVLLSQRYPDCTSEMQWLLSQTKITPRRMEFTLRAIAGVKKDTAHYVALLTAELGAEGAGAMLAWVKKQKRLCADQIEFTKTGGLTAETKKLVKETWSKGEEAIPVFTSLAKELVAKLNGATETKDQRKQLLTMLAVSDATEDTGCSSIYLDVLSEVGDRSMLATHLFEMASKNDPALMQYRKLLKEDIDQVTYQKNEGAK